VSLTCVYALRTPLLRFILQPRTAAQLRAAETHMLYHGVRALGIAANGVKMQEGVNGGHVLRGRGGGGGAGTAW
jgi:hypothetical protein